MASRVAGFAAGRRSHGGVQPLPSASRRPGRNAAYTPASTRLPAIPARSAFHLGKGRLEPLPLLGSPRIAIATRAAGT